ncbi:MAG: tungstate ABC transporter substrate-binding protein WtpA [Dehalococcoidia bacterium]|nr:MAG: tungstate ABC transporter substrate-binding protein WtpA [Dehalococcoidia bacterium]
MRNEIIAFSIALLLALGLMSGCSPSSPAEGLSGKLPIFHAGSLTIPFAQISEEFNKLYPDVEILSEGAGSQTTIRKVTELHKECGVIGSADYTVIPQLMFPEYADWYIIFATNQMCIAYTDQSQFADEINGDNWYEILQRDGVKYGRSDPDQDPCGYRTLMVWQLAESYYPGPGLYNKLYEAEGDLMRPKSVELIALLESGDLDYAFEYLSVAVQHKLNYIVLPAEINLANEEFRDFYAMAQVEISGKKPGETITKKGKPIVYGVTIPSNFPNQELAIAWVDFLLSDEGKAIMKANGQPPITPAGTNDKSRLPDELRKHVTGVD